MNTTSKTNKKSQQSLTAFTREALPEIDSFERIGYAYKIQQKLNVLAYQLIKMPEHRIINDRADNVSWCGTSFGTNMSVRITPDNPAMFGYWAEVRFHLEAAFNDKAAATVWVQYGGPHAGQKQSVINGGVSHVYADSFNELKDNCLDLVNSAIEEHVTSRSETPFALLLKALCSKDVQAFAELFASIVDDKRDNLGAWFYERDTSTNPPIIDYGFSVYDAGVDDASWGVLDITVESVNSHEIGFSVDFIGGDTFKITLKESSNPGLFKKLVDFERNHVDVWQSQRQVT